MKELQFAMAFLYYCTCIWMKHVRRRQKKKHLPEKQEKDKIMIAVRKKIRLLAKRAKGKKNEMLIKINKGARRKQ